MNKDKMELEDAISYLEKVILVNKNIIEQARKSNEKQLAEDVNTQNVALETVIKAIDNNKKEIQNLKEELQLVGMKVKNKIDNTVGIVLHQWENGNIAVLEKIEPTVINTHDSWKTLDIIIDDIINLKTKKITRGSL